MNTSQGTIQTPFHERAFCSSWWDALNGQTETTASASENKSCTPNFLHGQSVPMSVGSFPFGDNMEQLRQTLLASGLPDADLLCSVTVSLWPALLSSTSRECHVHTKFCFRVRFPKSLTLRYIHDPDELTGVLGTCHLT